MFLGTSATRLATRRRREHTISHQVHLCLIWRLWGMLASLVRARALNVAPPASRPANANVAPPGPWPTSEPAAGPWTTWPAGCPSDLWRCHWAAMTTALWTVATWTPESHVHELESRADGPSGVHLRLKAPGRSLEGGNGLLAGPTRPSALSTFTPVPWLETDCLCGRGLELLDKGCLKVSLPSKSCAALR